MSTPAIQVKEIEGKLVGLRERAQAIVVSDQETYTGACELVRDCRAYKRQVGFVLDPFIERARQDLDFARSEKAKYILPAEELERIVSLKAETWRAEEKRAAEAEARRLQEEARRLTEQKAAEERKAAEAQAEADRKLREAQIKEAQQAGELGKREAERLRKQAETDAAAAKEAAKEQEAVNAAAVPEVRVAPGIPKVSGIKGRTNWTFRVVDPGAVPRRYLVPDEVAIGGMVRAMKDKAKAEAECPGIEVWSEESI